MAGKKREFDAEKHCGGRLTNGRFCKNWKGFRTTHKGIGRCYRCGGTKKGDKRVKHGLSSNIYKAVASASLKEAIEAAEKAPLLDLSSELNTLKGLLRDFIGRHKANEDEAVQFLARYGGVVNTIIKSDKPEIIAAAIAKLKENSAVPRAGLDMDSAAKLIEAIRRTVETIHTLQQKTTITMAACAAWAERLAMGIRKHIKDRKQLESLLKDLDKIEPPGGWPTYSEPHTDG